MYRKAEIEEKIVNNATSRTNMTIDNRYIHVPLYGSLKSRFAIIPVPKVMANHLSRGQRSNPSLVLISRGLTKE
jgi:hypothetical protein